MKPTVAAWRDAIPVDRAVPALCPPGVVNLVLVPADAHAWISRLSSAELSRAAAIRSQQQRAEFITGRAVVKTLAGTAARADPRQVQVEPQCPICGSVTHGKPVIRNAGAPHVSVAHRDGNVLVALTIDGPIGVDLEVDRPVPELDEMARVALTAGERSRLRSLDGAEASRWFLARWCLKEALTKRSGAGLTRDFTSLEVDGEDDRVVELVGALAPPGLLGAVAITGRTREIRWIHF